MKRLYSSLRSLCLAVALCLISASPAGAQAFRTAALQTYDLSLLPPGAIGVWYASDYVASPRKRIPNRIANGAPDPNVLNAPRRLFNVATASYWTTSLGGGVTLVDQNATAPDGSNEASTLTSPGAVAWTVRSLSGTVTNGAYTICVTARMTSGSGDFRLGEITLGYVTQTATGTFQRFCNTVTVTGGTLSATITAPVAQPAQTLVIADFQAFPGSADLNPAPLTAKPLSIQNADLIIGKTQYDNTGGVSGGFLNDVNGAVSLIQFPNILSLGSFTVVYVTKPSVAPGSTNFIGMLADAKLYTNFEIGYATGHLGTKYKNVDIDAAYNSIATQAYSDLWSQPGAGVFVGANRYTGTVTSVFVNGIIGSKNTITSTAPTTTSDLSVGFLSSPTSFYSGHSIAAIALYPGTALTNQQIVQAGNILLAHESLAVAASRMVLFFGTSITFGAQGKSYAYQYAANASPITKGFNLGVSGAGFTTIQTSVLAVLAQLASYNYPPQQIIFSLEIGANDLDGPTTGAALATQVMGLCDTIRAAGYKVVLHTVISRGDHEVEINTQRAIYNPIIRGWIGTHVDDIVDVAADPTLGCDTGCTSNATYFADTIHPTTAGYVIWETIIRPVINGL